MFTSYTTDNSWVINPETGIAEPVPRYIFLSRKPLGEEVIDWLHEEGFDIQFVHTTYDLEIFISTTDKAKALLFKLTWGGSI